MERMNITISKRSMEVFLGSAVPRMQMIMRGESDPSMNLQFVRGCLGIVAAYAARERPNIMRDPKKKIKRFGDEFQDILFVSFLNVLRDVGGVDLFDLAESIQKEEMACVYRTRRQMAGGKVEKEEQEPLVHALVEEIRKVASERGVDNAVA